VSSTLLPFLLALNQLDLLGPQTPNPGPPRVLDTQTHPYNQLSALGLAKGRPLAIFSLPRSLSLFTRPTSLSRPMLSTLVHPFLIKKGYHFVVKFKVTLPSPGDETSVVEELKTKIGFDGAFRATDLQ
jgi:hypothetical protein